MKRVFLIGTTGLGQQYGVGRYLEILLNEGSNYTSHIEFISINFEITNKLKNTKITRKENITFMTIPVIEMKMNFCSYPLLISGLVSLIGIYFNAGEKDTFHFNSCMGMSLANAINAKLKARIVYTSHFAIWREYFNSFEDFQEKWTIADPNTRQKWELLTQEYKLSNLSEKIICLSRENYNVFSRIFKVSEEKLLLIPNGLPAKHGKIAKNSIFSSKITSKEHTIIFYCGRIDKEKGVRELIAALNLIHKKRQNFICLFAGSGDISNLLASYTHLWGNVLFTGYINDRTVLNWVYKRADILVMPSKHEQSSFVLLEGLQYGKAIILSSIPAFEDVAEPNCLKMPLSNSSEQRIIEKSLADRTLFLMENPKAMQRIGKNAKKLFKEKFQIEDKFILLAEQAYCIKLTK